MVKTEDRKGLHSKQSLISEANIQYSYVWLSSNVHIVTLLLDAGSDHWLTINLVLWM